MELVGEKLPLTQNNPYVVTNGNDLFWELTARGGSMLRRGVSSALVHAWFSSFMHSTMEERRSTSLWSSVTYTPPQCGYPLSRPARTIVLTISTINMRNVLLPFYWSSTWQLHKLWLVDECCLGHLRFSAALRTMYFIQCRRNLDLNQMGSTFAALVNTLAAMALFPISIKLKEEI